MVVAKVSPLAVLRAIALATATVVVKDMTWASIVDVSTDAPKVFGWAAWMAGQTVRTKAVHSGKSSVTRRAAQKASPVVVVTVG